MSLEGLTPMELPSRCRKDHKQIHSLIGADKREQVIPTTLTSHSVLGRPLREDWQLCPEDRTRRARPN